MRVWTMLAAVAAAAPAWAQPAVPDGAALGQAVRMGTLATLAPLCRMRDEAWAFDLRRAMVMDATRSPSPQDPALRAAPGRELAEGALSFAEAEALEAFAESPAAVTCEPLSRDAGLAEADRRVQAFRALRGPEKPGS